MLLKLENVKKQYDSFNLDCSIELRKGQVTGIIGRNGAGKSTTFKSILGLIFPDSGNIEIFETPIDKLTTAAKEDIGVVLSDSNINELLRPTDMIPVLKALYKNFSSEEFLNKCKELNIPLTKPIKEFSTGMKAKFKLIIAMSHNPKLLILDEPTAGLDVIMRRELLDMLREYMEDEEHGILISSHISTDLEGLCDDLYFISKGKILIHEDTDVLLSEYCLLKLTQEQFQNIDKSFVIKTLQDNNTYLCLTNQKSYYQENYPDIAIERGNIDDFIIMMEKGENN